MKKISVLISLLFILIFFSQSCGSRKSVVKKFYVLDLPAASETILSDSISTIDKYCEIVPVSTYPAYSTRQIVIRSQSHEVRYFTYHEWAVRPQEILTRLMEEYFRQQGVFKEASLRFWKIIPEVQVETTVYNLEIFEENNDFTAHLNIEFRLVENQSGKLILRQTAKNFRELKKRDLNLFASAISDMYLEALRNFAIKVMDFYATSTENI